MTAPTEAAEITLRMTTDVADRIHGTLVEGYRIRRFDADATPDYCADVLRVIDSLVGQLKMGGQRG